MRFETDKISIPLWTVLIFALGSIAALFCYWYYATDDNNIKLLGLLGGIVSGLVVFILTFVTLLKPLQQLDRFHRMGIKGLLANRHDKDYYRQLVMNAKREVDVMGASCARFIDDFLDIESEDRVLIDALSKHDHLTVRFLIPEEPYMNHEAKARARAALPKLARLESQFGLRVELRRFGDYARHSLVIVDDDLIAGPIFNDDKSKYAPAVHAATRTVFAQKYINHFDDVWKNSTPSA